MTPLTLAMRFVGELAERPGPAAHHPFIVWSHELCRLRETGDEIPWCSSFANAICWMLRRPRSKSARARSWLGVGQAVAMEDATPGDVVVVLARGAGPQPGPEVLDAPGHVAFYAGVEGDRVLVVGGNQANNVTLARYPITQVLGLRGLWT